MAKSEYPLETFVRHILLRRLALTTAVITLGVALISYAVQRHSIETRVVEVARAQIALLLTRTRAIASAQSLNPHEAFRRALTELGDTKTSGTAGRFVWTRFYGPDLSFIAEDVDTAYAHREEAAAFVRAAKLEHPAAEETYFELVEVAGDPHLHVVLPMIGARGTVVGYAQGLFAVTATVVTQARRALARNVWIAVSIVLATTALLYPVILRLTARLAWFSGQLLESNLAELSLLGAAIAKRDSDTDAHNYRVTLYSVRLAEAVDLSATEMQALIKGAFLHDVGKIGIRDVILLKPGRLHEDEFRIMKQHVNHGLDITGRSPWLRDAAAVVGGHHEKFDGSGYPSGLAGENIPVEARIFAIADVFDALTSRRPYKEPLSYEATMEILEEGCGSHFDPALLDAFRRIAPDLHARYSGREDDGMRQELEALTSRYFAAGAASLRY